MCKWLKADCSYLTFGCLCRHYEHEEVKLGMNREMQVVKELGECCEEKCPKGGGYI